MNISEALRETQYIYQTNNTSRHYVHAIYPASETKPNAGDFYSDGHRTCNVSSAMMNLNSLYPKEFKKLMADYKSKELEKKPEIIQLANQRDEILSCTGLGKYCDEKKNLFPPVGNDLRGDIRTKNQNAKKEWESLAEIIWVYEHTVGFKKVGCPKADAYLYAECQQKAVTRFLQEYGYIKAEDNTYVISSELTNYTANQELLYNILSTNNNFFAYVGNYYTGSGHVVPVYGTASKGSDKYFIMNDPYGSISLDENKRAFYPKNKESGLANVRTINTLAHARSGVHFATMPYFMLYAKCKNNDELCVKSIDERINKWNEDFKLYLNGNKFKKTKLE